MAEKLAGHPDSVPGDPRGRHRNTPGRRPGALLRVCEVGTVGLPGPQSRPLIGALETGFPIKKPAVFAGVRISNRRGWQKTGSESAGIAKTGSCGYSALAENSPSFRVGNLASSSLRWGGTHQVRVRAPFKLTESESRPQLDLVSPSLAQMVQVRSLPMGPARAGLRPGLASPAPARVFPAVPRPCGPLAGPTHAPPFRGFGQGGDSEYPMHVYALQT